MLESILAGVGFTLTLVMTIVYALLILLLVVIVLVVVPNLMLETHNKYKNRKIVELVKNRRTKL